MKKTAIRWLAMGLMVTLLAGSPFAAGSASAETEDSLNQTIEEGNSAISDAKDEKDELKSGLSAAQAMKKELEQSKDELTTKVVELDSQLSEVSVKLADVENLLSQKEEEIQETTQKLAEAKKNEVQQYEAMKKRIRFMYEKGSTAYIQILLSAESFGEMLNKAEYIEQLSEYDRKMLEEYQETKDSIARLQEDLESQKTVLEDTKAEVEEEQNKMAGLISEKKDQIDYYTDNIENKEEAIAQYEEEIKIQDATIASMEAAVAAAKAKRAQMNVSENSTDEPSYNGGTFCWPAPSYTRISDDYGYRIHPILGIKQFHSGVDMAAPSGSSILAAYDGVVVAATYNSTMGNYIMIDHGSGLYTIYMHASALYVSEGQSVSKGSTIGAVGSTGRSTGSHLHFGVRLNGSYVSPWNYL